MIWKRRGKRSRPPIAGGAGWIGVDLDGTLAEYNGSIATIGPPVTLMMRRVRAWLSEGRVVKIMTARAADRNQVRMIRDWCRKNDLPPLEVTDRKDFHMTELWDDRAVQVEHNTGKPILWLNDLR
jgi:hypothetical protein